MTTDEYCHILEESAMIRLTAKEAKKCGIAVKKKRATKKAAAGKAKACVAGEAFKALCVAHGLPEPEAEYYFAPTRGFRWDWAWVIEDKGGRVLAKIAVEQEGGIFGTGKPCPVCKQRRGGGHSSITGLLRDMEKYTLGNILCWCVIRALPRDVASGKVLDLVKQALAVRGFWAMKKEMLP